MMEKESENTKAHEKIWERQDREREERWQAMENYFDKPTILKSVGGFVGILIGIIAIFFVVKFCFCKK